MTGRDLIIEMPARRSWWLCWRDRCLTLLLWGAWSRPVDALARIAVGQVQVDPESAALSDAFLRDLGDVASVTSVLIVALYTWGGYARCQRKAK